MATRTWLMPTTNAHELFGNGLFVLLNQRGWNAIPKRELVIHLNEQAARAGLVDLDAPRARLVQQLMIPPATLDALLRDRLLLTRQASIFNHEEFSAWARGNHQTSSDDNEKGQLVFSVGGAAESMQVEGYLDSLGIVADYKNNRRLLVLDLGRLVSALSVHSNVLATDLIANCEANDDKRRRLLEQASGSDRQLIKLFLRAIREQAEQRVGEKTVEFGLVLIARARKGVEKIVGKAGA